MPELQIVTVEFHARLMPNVWKHAHAIEDRLTKKRCNVNTNVEKLKEWFDALPASDQKKVLEFLYGKNLLNKGLYAGPYPESLTEGLHVGPIPTSSTTSACPTCGKPW